jgi:penicillin-binding protein 1A
MPVFLTLTNRWSNSSSTWHRGRSTSRRSPNSWVIGFTPALAVGVYVGYDTPRPMGRDATGGQLAAPIVAQFMRQALGPVSATPFRVPAGVQLIPIDPNSGERAAYGDDNVILEAFKPGEDPATMPLVIGDTIVPVVRPAAFTGRPGEPISHQ